MEVKLMIEDTQFNIITCYNHHILQPYLPDRLELRYNLGER